jgi:hypothetical protein
LNTFVKKNNFLLDLKITLRKNFITFWFNNF